AQLIAQSDRISVFQPQPFYIFARHQHIIAPRSGNGIHFRIDNAVELLPSARGQQEASGRHLLLGQLDGAEMSLSIRCQTTVHQQSWAAVLEVVALLFQGSYSFISRTDAIYLIADVLRVFPGEGSFGPSWIQ